MIYRFIYLVGLLAKAEALSPTREGATQRQKRHDLPHEEKLIWKVHECSVSSIYISISKSILTVIWSNWPADSIKIFEW